MGMHSNAKHGLNHKGSKSGPQMAESSDVSEYDYSAGNAKAPHKAEQGPSRSLLTEHELQHVDYGEITGGESTPL